MSKPILYLLILISIPMLGLIGCSHEPVSQESTKVLPKETVEVAVFEGGYGIQFYEHAKEKFEEEFPHVEIELIFSPRVQEIIRPRFIANNPPDVISEWVDKDLYPYAEAGVLETFNELLGEEVYGESYKLSEKLDNNAIMTCMPMNDTKIYYLPTSVAYSGLYYNKALFREKGYKSPKTWEEFFRLGEQAKKDNIALYAYPGLYSHYNGMILFPSMRSHLSAKELDDISNARVGAWRVQGIEDCISIFKRIADEGFLLKDCIAMSHTQVQREWLEDKVLFIPGGTWIEQEMQNAIPSSFEFGYIPTPVFDEHTEEIYMQEGYGYAAVPLHGKNPQWGKKFLNYLYREDMIQASAKLNGAIVPTKDILNLVGDDIYPSVRTTFEISDTVYTSTQNWFAIERIATENLLYKNIDALIMGEFRVEDVVDGMEARTKEIRQDLYGE